MCDEEAYHALNRRVDELEKKIAVIDSAQAAMRAEMKEGFTGLHEQLSNIYAEKAEWGKWLREKLPPALKWIGKWIVVLTVAAIGVNNLPTILSAFGFGK